MSRAADHSGNTDDDAEIVALVLEGHVERFRTLVEKYQGKLLCFVANLIRDPAEAEDLAQEAFLIAYSNLGRFDPQRGRFSAWLFAIAKNRSLNAIAKKCPVAVAEIDRMGGGDVGREMDTKIAHRQALRQLDRALEALPVDQRVVFVLAEIMELTLAEVAEIEGLAVGTVKSRLSRAKAKLRLAIAEQRSALDATG